MAVYTSLTKPEIIEFLASYAVGPLVSYEGIGSGIENTNYFVNTRDHALVLTIFETVTAAEVPYFLALTSFLADQGIPCAHPVSDLEGQQLRCLKNKPAALVQRLTGSSHMNPEAAHCRALGHALAQLHLAGVSFPLRRDNPRGTTWMRNCVHNLAPVLATQQCDYIENELETIVASGLFDAPGGPVHGDLFRDNALFVGKRLTGIIDFYFACDAPYIYDLAVSVNDWCSNSQGSLNRDCARAMLLAYAQVRAMSSEEQACWPFALRAAALRFWLSRLGDQHFPRNGELTHIHDPEIFQRILAQRQREHSTLDQLLVPT